MKLVSWNVNGLRAVLGKGFLDYVAEENPDILCLQETKLQPEQAVFDLDGYHRFFNSADKKGYSGTAILTKEEPLSVTYDFGDDIHRHEGRIITATKVASSPQSIPIFIWSAATPPTARMSSNAWITACSGRTICARTLRNWTPSSPWCTAAT